MSKRLQGLYMSRTDLKDMILRATTNSEKAERIELLEMRLNRISAKIDDENMKLYGGETING